MKKNIKSNHLWDIVHYNNKMGYYHNIRKTNPDTINRKEVIQKMMDKINNGASIDEAVDSVLEDSEIRGQFSYLEKNGLDIRVCFKNWVTANIKNEEKKQERQR